MAKILITGGSGLLGKTISENLLEQGHSPVWLSREAGQYKSIRKFRWDIEKRNIDPEAFEGVQHIVHLAGAGIMDARWTAKYKQEITDSRVKSSELLYEQLSKRDIRLSSVVGGSAVGYYGSDTGSEDLTESHGAGTDFLSEVCKAWEKSYDPFIQKNIRTVIIRTGVVMSDQGGAYPKLASAARLGLAAPIGSGAQFFPWIHIRDIAGIFTKAIFDEHMDGVYNGVASELVTNEQFTKKLAKSFGKKVVLPHVPGWVLRLALGERALALTSGQKADNGKIRSGGYRFEFADLESALRDLALKI